MVGGVQVKEPLYLEGELTHLSVMAMLHVTCHGDRWTWALVVGLPSIIPGLLSPRMSSITFN